MASGTAGTGKAERRRLHEERKHKRTQSAQFERRFTWISLALIFSGPVLGTGAAALGAAEVYPSDYLMTVGMTVMLIPIGLGFLVASCAGMYALGGLKAAPFGAILVAGLGVLAYGIAVADNFWRDAGVVLLAVSCASFWAVPAWFSPRTKAKRRPATAPKSVGLISVLVIGAAIAAVGYVLDEWWVLLFGAMSVGTVVGAGFAMQMEDRRSREVES